MKNTQLSTVLAMGHRSQLLAVVAAFLVVNLVTPNGYVPLPVSVERFDHLYNRHVLDAMRFKYRGKGVVYAIVNNLNGKLYVGSTSQSDIRWYNHLVSGRDSNRALRNAIKLYGLGSFSLVVLDVFNLPSEDSMINKLALLDKEQIYLDLFPSAQKYNFAIKADGGRGSMSNEEKELISKRMKGVNVGRAPINKGVAVSPALLALMRKGSAHRYFDVFIYDEMNNLVA